MTKLTIEIDSSEPAFEAVLAALGNSAFISAATEQADDTAPERATPRTTRARRSKKDDAPLPGADAANDPSAPFVVLKSDGDTGATFQLGAEAAKALVALFEAAPDRASLDNMLKVNAPIIGRLASTESDAVTRAYAGTVSKFAAEPTKSIKSDEPEGASAQGGTPGAPSMSSLFEEEGEDAPAPGMPTDPKELKAATRDMMRDYIMSIGTIEGGKYMAEFGGAQGWSQIEAKHYAKIWADLKTKEPATKAKLAELAAAKKA